MRISEFNFQKQLTTGFSSQIIQDCESFDEYKELDNWKKKKNPKDMNIAVPIKGSAAVGKYKPLVRLEEEANLKLVDANEKIFSDVKAFVVFIRNNENAQLFYLSCPSEKCMRKVIEESDGWKCEKCNKTYPEVILLF